MDSHARPAKRGRKRIEMGLDMYLTAKRSMLEMPWKTQEERDTCAKLRSVMPEMYQSGNLNSIDVEFEAGYWRKANQIHAWFVKECQGGEDDCRSAYVSREKLAELRQLCIDAKTEPEKKLPTKSGFFFGSTEYDDDYMADLEATVAIIDKCLALPKEWDFYYRSSW